MAGGDREVEDVGGAQTEAGVGQEQAACELIVLGRGFEDDVDVARVLVERLLDGVGVAFEDAHAG